MPSYTYTDAEASHNELVPDGDYKAEVVGFETGIQQGNGPTRGSDYIEVQLKIESDAGKPLTRIWDRLIFHEKTSWKIDTFLKSFGFVKPDGSRPRKGESVDVTEGNTEGLRGWVHVIQEDYMPAQKPGQPAPEKRTVNRVKAYLTDRAPLRRAEPHDPFAE